MDYYISMDVGGTAIKYGVISEQEEIIEKGNIPTESKRGGAVILKQATQIVESFANYQPKGICISTTGMVDPVKGRIFYSGESMTDYTGTEWKTVLEETFKIPCEVENDSNCAGLAECISGAAKGYDSVLCLTIGTGIGGSFIYRGEIFHGYSNSACEVGHMHVGNQEFQSLCSTNAMVRKVAEAKGETADRWSGFRIFAEAALEDPVCNEAIDELIDVLAKGIANICYILNPQAIVLGGGIMEQKGILRTKIDQALQRYLLSVMYQQTKILFAEHQNEAGVLGAFYNFRNKNKVT